jgi:hypothetical protein
MKYAICLLIFLGSCTNEPVNFDSLRVKANDNIVDTVWAKVDQVSYYKANAYLNFGGEYPNQKFSVFIPGGGLKDVLGYQLDNLQGKKIKIIGEIRLYEGKPQIILRNKEQIYAF